MYDAISTKTAFPNAPKLKSPASFILHVLFNAAWKRSCKDDVSGAPQKTPISWHF
jgi:hypothetical protein